MSSILVLIFEIQTHSPGWFLEVPSRHHWFWLLLTLLAGFSYCDHISARCRGDCIVREPRRWVPVWLCGLPVLGHVILGLKVCRPFLYLTIFFSPHLFLFFFFGWLCTRSLFSPQDYSGRQTLLTQFSDAFLLSRKRKSLSLNFAMISWVVSLVSNMHLSFNKS